jgi:putative oxygen-independent coproporphyrinogen III oxidase
LAGIGRIHGREEVMRAVDSLHAAGIDNFNIDLMFALPGQDLAAAEQDVRAAIGCAPSHLSHYQLTIEPNTAFHADPPTLPADDLAWDMQAACGALLTQSGFEQYEVSAWALPGRECAHNLNYWRYGDYLGIGAGAHGKLTLAAEQIVRRRVRVRHPVSWMRAVACRQSVAEDRSVPAEERVFEFFLNQLRLRSGVHKALFEARTGLAWTVVADRAAELVAKGLAKYEGEWLRPTELGWRFSNESQALFLP